MLFSNKRGNPKFQVYVDNTYLEEKQNATFLGVIIDKKLLWKNHIKLVCSKRNKSIGILCEFYYLNPMYVNSM